MSIFQIYLLGVGLAALVNVINMLYNYFFYCHKILSLNFRNIDHQWSFFHGRYYLTGQIPGSSIFFWDSLFSYFSAFLNIVSLAKSMSEDFQRSFLSRNPNHIIEIDAIIKNQVLEPELFFALLILKQHSANYEIMDEESINRSVNEFVEIHNSFSIRKIHFNKVKEIIHARLDKKYSLMAS